MEGKFGKGGSHNDALHQHVITNMNNISDIKVGLREKTVAESGGKHFMLSAPD